jgi:hypothetical protein
MVLSIVNAAKSTLQLSVNFTPECLAIEVAQNLLGEDVVVTLQRLRDRRLEQP